MKEGIPRIDGLILMEATLRGPEHPGGAALRTQFALVQKQEHRLATCGELSFGSLPMEMWSEAVRGAFLAFVEVLEEHALLHSGVFEEGEKTDAALEVVHAVVGGSEPTEF